MSDEITLQDILEVQEHFGLPSPALVEKDWYVVRALAAIAAADLTPLRVIFGGGTALGRAHRLIDRMSEDIDLKIVAAEDEPARGALRHLRETVTGALLQAGFQFDPENREHRRTGNETRYTVYHLPYVPLVAGEGALRPEIMIETAVWPLRRPAVELPVSSFVAEALGRSIEIASIAVVSVTQTAAEKFVALTRRVAAELALAEEERDPTLVRHIYDLHVTRDHYDAGEVAALASEIMPHDAIEFGNREPRYRADPMAETRRALDALQADPHYARQYAEFSRYMVYGDRVDYADALATVLKLGGLLQRA